MCLVKCTNVREYYFVLTAFRGGGEDYLSKMFPESLLELCILLEKATVFIQKIVPLTG